MYRREPVVAGSFYPGDPETLRAQVNKYLDEAESSAYPRADLVLGVIAPHAGYIYSGSVAAYGYSCLKHTDFDGFVVIAPSHRGRFDGASVIPEGEYATPLGDVHIDSEIGAALLKKDNFEFIHQAHEMEHSLEVQVPFIQVINEDALIVPVIVGTADLDICSEIGNSIASVLIDLKKNYGIIVSTDLSHYHDYDSAMKLDNAFVKGLESFDTRELKSVLSSGKGEACGAGAVFAGMAAAEGLGAKKISVVKYANSGDTAGPRDQVVGYLSAVFSRSGEGVVK